MCNKDIFMYMKMLIKESQLKMLVEEIEFTPEKIRELINKTEKLVDIIEREYKKQKEFILTKKIGELIKESENTEKLHGHLKNVKETIRSKYDYLINIVDSTDEMRDDINELEEITTFLDEYGMKFDDLISILEVFKYVKIE